MKYIITGGNFSNKGAQAMTFITVAKLREWYPECNIIMMDVVCDEKRMNNNSLLFERVFDGVYQRLYISSFMGKIISSLIQFMRKLIKGNCINLKQYKNYYDNVDAIFDISGYAIGSNWSFKSNISYILLLKSAKKLKIPIFLLPQSFGPFDYKGLKGKFIDLQLDKYLKYPSIIFAREKSGYDDLITRYQLKNVKSASDIVMAGKNVSFDKVVSNNNDFLGEKIKIDKNTIALIPSVNNFRFDNASVVRTMYKVLLEFLSGKNEKIYLIAHSNEDLQVCKELKDLFNNYNNIILINQELSFIQFKEMCHSFKMMIASRFHSIVLGYGEGVPSIILGWADKYHEISKVFNQEQFVIDTASIKNSEEVLVKIEQMRNECFRYAEEINAKLEEFDNNDCFKIIKQYLENK